MRGQKPAGCCRGGHLSEKLFCDFCQREIDKTEIPSRRFEVKISVSEGTRVLLRRDACLECAQKIETILVGLPLGIQP